MRCWDDSCMRINYQISKNKGTNKSEHYSEWFAVFAWLLSQIDKNWRRDSIWAVLIRLYKFLFSKQTIIDLITIMPSYLDPILVFYCSFIDCKYEMINFKQLIKARFSDPRREQIFKDWGCALVCIILGIIMLGVTYTILLCLRCLCVESTPL